MSAPDYDIGQPSEKPARSGVLRFRNLARVRGIVALVVAAGVAITGLIAGIAGVGRSAPVAPAPGGPVAGNSAVQYPATQQPSIPGVPVANQSHSAQRTVVVAPANNHAHPAQLAPGKISPNASLSPDEVTSLKDAGIYGAVVAGAKKMASTPRLGLTDGQAQALVATWIAGSTYGHPERVQLDGLTGSDAVMKASSLFSFNVTHAAANNPAGWAQALKQTKSTGVEYVQAADKLIAMGGLNNAAPGISNAQGLDQ